MNRLVKLAAVSLVTAVATRAARRYLAAPAPRARRSAAHRPLDTWENEGGNLPPHEQRSLQQQLG